MSKNISICLLVALGLSFNACGDGSSSSDSTTTVSNDDGTITHNGVTYKTVTSPYTAKVWLDRNLGASQVCTALDDSACYGDYYQWGRATDGHENNESITTAALSNTLSVGHDNFIVNGVDWIDTSVDDNGSLREANWSKTDGTSVCPVGYRVPTITELTDETINASTAVTNNTDAFNNFLKLPSVGFRNFNAGSLTNQGSNGFVWSSSVAASSRSQNLFFNSSLAYASYYFRTNGFSIRCLKD